MPVCNIQLKKMYIMILLRPVRYPRLIVQKRIILIQQWIVHQLRRKIRKRKK